MTARELIKALQELGEENLDREVVMCDREIVMFGGPLYYTPYKVEVLKDRKWGRQYGKVLVD